MTPSAVIQVKRGIGDVIWHLPFVRAIAAVSIGHQVTFLAPPSSHAKELLAAEPSVAETIYFEHGGSELRRGLNLARLAALLRCNHYRTVWVLDRTIRPALAAMLARVPERIGLGLGPQRMFITNSGIDMRHFHDQPIEWLVALMAAMKVPLQSTEPKLQVAVDLLKATSERFAHLLRPWFVLGIGASEADKDWPDAYWVEFIAKVCRSTTGTVFLVGGAENNARAKNLIARSAATSAINTCDLALAEATALLHLADVFVGTDSGPMNIAAATATDAFAMFGATPVLNYSKFIHPIVPEGGPSPDGMQRISPARVLESVAPYLTAKTE